MIPNSYEKIMKKRPGGGQIVELLDWAINGGPAKWCDDVTYAADKTIEQLFVTAKDFTVNVGITLTLSYFRPLVVVADTIIINGAITGSARGCYNSATGSDGKRCTIDGGPFFHPYYNEEISSVGNYCLCGSGGGASSVRSGGGAFKAGGAPGTIGNDCDLTSAELKELLFSPLFTVSQIGLGGSGACYTTTGLGSGGSSILLVGRLITLSSTSSILANGGSTATNDGGGGGGFIGLIGDTLSIDGAATVTANGGVASAGGFDGGAGAIAQIEV